MTPNLKHAARTELCLCLGVEAINIVLLAELYLCGEIATTKIAPASTRHERHRRDMFTAAATPKAISSARSGM